MAQFHFVEDYERLVAKLIASHPIDEAMALAVGGNYELNGQVEAALLKKAGLADGMRLIDLGCGSGRLAAALHGAMRISYVGIDIVQALLDYAKTKAPPYEFILHRGLSIPRPDGSADMVSAFSLFTHLLHAETYLYLEECVRVLKPGGKVVFSFLEFAEPAHWDVFLQTRDSTRENALAHLNTFIERSVISTWATRLGLVVEQYIAAREPVWNAHAFGQSTVVLRRATEGSHAAEVPPAANSYIRFALDVPASRKMVPGETRFIGWCLGPGDRPPTALRIRAGQEIFPARADIPRPDVVTALSTAATALKCGFDAPVTVPRGPSKIAIEARFDGETDWQTIDEFEVPA